MGLRSGADGKDFPCPEARSSAGAAGAAAAWRWGASFKREMGWKSSEWPQSSGAGGGGSQRGGGRRGVRVPSVSPRSAEAGALSVPCARRLVLSQPLRRSGGRKRGGGVGFCTTGCSGSELGGLACPQGAQNKGKGGTRARLAACRCLFVPVPVGPLAAQSLRCHLCPCSAPALHFPVPIVPIVPTGHHRGTKTHRHTCVQTQSSAPKGGSSTTQGRGLPSHLMVAVSTSPSLPEPRSEPWLCPRSRPLLVSPLLECPHIPALSPHPCSVPTSLQCPHVPAVSPYPCSVPPSLQCPPVPAVSPYPCSVPTSLQCPHIPAVSPSPCSVPTSLQCPHIPALSPYPCSVPTSLHCPHIPAVSPHPWIAPMSLQCPHVPAVSPSPCPLPMPWPTALLIPMPASPYVPTFPPLFLPTSQPRVPTQALLVPMPPPKPCPPPTPPFSWLSALPQRLQLQCLFGKQSARGAALHGPGPPASPAMAPFPAPPAQQHRTPSTHTCGPWGHQALCPPPLRPPSPPWGAPMSPCAPPLPPPQWGFSPSATHVGFIPIPAPPNAAVPQQREGAGGDVAPLQAQAI